jgi:hypothetical protein
VEDAFVACVKISPGASEKILSGYSEDSNLVPPESQYETLSSRIFVCMSVSKKSAACEHSQVLTPSMKVLSIVEAL